VPLFLVVGVGELCCETSHMAAVAGIVAARSVRLQPRCARDFAP
jgi:hypothetical protein